MSSCRVTTGLLLGLGGLDNGEKAQLGKGRNILVITHRDRSLGDHLAVLRDLHNEHLVCVALLSPGPGQPPPVCVLLGGSGSLLFSKLGPLLLDLLLLRVPCPLAPLGLNVQDTAALLPDILPAAFLHRRPMFESLQGHVLGLAVHFLRICKRIGWSKYSDIANCHDPRSISLGDLAGSDITEKRSGNMLTGSLL